MAADSAADSRYAPPLGYGRGPNGVPPSAYADYGYTPSADQQEYPPRDAQGYPPPNAQGHASGYGPPGYVPPGYPPSGYGPPGYVPPPGYLPPGYLPPGYPPSGYAPPGYAPSGYNSSYAPSGYQGYNPGVYGPQAGWYPYPQPPPLKPASRRWRAVASIAIVVVIVAGVAGLTHLSSRLPNSPAGQSSGQPQAAPQLGTFAGYAWWGSVDQVSAQWSVPRIVNTSVQDQPTAATWIGVQGPSKSEFFQIGTMENVQDGHVVDQAFWSDTPRHFHAQFLMNVKSGDVVDAVIQHAQGGWVSSITDQTTRQTQTAPVDPSDVVNLDQVEWLQEDPTLASGKAAPYPDIDPTKVSDMKVDSAPPDPSDMVPNWMVLPHGHKVIPGPFVSDGFTTRAK
ncbi:MAG: G1 family glutamic endopeptidase [Acidimicrobiales bacterium]